MKTAFTIAAGVIVIGGLLWVGMSADVIPGPWPGSAGNAGLPELPKLPPLDEGGWPTSDSPTLPSGDQGDEMRILLPIGGGFLLLIAAFLNARKGNSSQMALTA